MCVCVCAHAFVCVCVCACMHVCECVIVTVTGVYKDIGPWLYDVLIDLRGIGVFYTTEVLLQRGSLCSVEGMCNGSCVMVRRKSNSIS